MLPKNATPLGYIELPDGSKAIYPMNDIFLNYTFENATNWEALRLTVNIIIEAYRLINPNTKASPITGAIKVRTQFRQLVGNKKTRDQDIKLTQNEKDITYIEYQNRGITDPPIEIRSVVYFGLGIGHSKGKLANQIWLLAEDVPSVLHGKTFARYTLKDELTNNEHPTISGILYISLPKLMQEASPAGELAALLLGKASNPKDEQVKKITDTFNASFKDFKDDKDVMTAMTAQERWYGDGKVEGKAEGRAEGIFEAAKKFLEKGMSLKEVAETLNLADSQISQLEEAMI